MTQRDFQEIVWEHYRSHGRLLPWREPEPDGSFNAYKIWVSELMLQQTQVARVIPKYQAFLEMFPSIQSLASAELGQVLGVWNGLGYNRRAKFLWQAAQEVVAHYGGTLPETLDELVALPGIGKNTAGAILVYAFNQPLVFVETNIRTVFIHHFFQDKDGVDDKELLPLIAETLDTEHPREWYWALMDYGSFLKREVGNVSRASKHFVKQSSFVGSRRQVRGAIIRELTAGQKTYAQLAAVIADERLAEVLSELKVEGLLQQQDSTYQL